jgi:gamma-glutamyl-gamma-aminobutyraldehyde dehydrogenase
MSGSPIAHRPDSLSEWNDVRARVSLPSAMWIDGDWSGGMGAESYPVITPRDSSQLCTLPSASSADVDRAVDGARRSFRAGDWSPLDPRERGRILNRWADIMDAERDELALLVALEMGKPASMAFDVELRSSITLLQWYGEMADKLIDESPRDRRDALALVTREPVGVVGAITPWNWPVTLAMFKLPAALVSGNSAVVKPAGQTPLSLLRIAEQSKRAGLPDGVLQVVTGEGGVGEAIGRHMDVDVVTFTGSTGVGKKLLAYSAESNGKPVWLELGGKSPNVIFADADLERAARTAAWAITFNSGQMCTAGSRLIVHEDVAATVQDRIFRYFDELRKGDPLEPATEFGPLAFAHHRQRVLDEVRRGEQEARLVYGGSVTHSDGCMLEPVAFADVDPNGRLAQFEIFGPVLSIFTFKDEREALDLANNTTYGLGASLWTRDLRRAHRAARAIEAGTVWVNCFEEGDASVPFGGRKLSGHGSEKSIHGIERFTTVKTTWIDLSP